MNFARYIILFLCCCLLIIITYACGKDESTPKQKNEIGSIRVRMAESKQEYVKGEDKIRLPNCEGTEVLTRSLGVERSVKRNTSTESKATTGAGIEVQIPAVVKMQLEGQIEQTYEDMFESAKSRTDGIIMKARPGTHVIYNIQWIRKKYASTVSYAIGDQVLQVPYEFVLDMPDIRDSKQIECPQEEPKPSVTHVEIVPDDINVKIGESAKLRVNLRSASGNIILGPSVKWSSNNPSIATVYQDGRVVGHKGGNTTVIADSEGVKGWANVSVQPSEKDDKPPTISFPTKGITMIVPFGPAGYSDYMARVVAKGLQSTLGKTVSVVNVLGQGGAVGWRRAASANPDGYTITLYTNSLPIEAEGRPSLIDFEPIAMFAKGFGLLAPKGTVKERIRVLENATREAVESRDFKSFLRDKGQVPYFVDSRHFFAEAKNR